MRKLLVLFIAIVLLYTQGACGFSVSSVSIIPHGNLEDRTPVTVTCEIPRTGIMLYDQLVIATDLDSPAWEPVVIVHDQETPVTPASATGNTLVVNGAAFNYPEPVPVRLRVGVRGTVPVNHTTNQTLLDIRQIDSAGTPYAWPAGNYTLPMPGAPSANGSGTGVTPAPTAEKTFIEYPVPVTPAPVPKESSLVTSVPIPKQTLILPTPLPARSPAAAGPAGPLVVLGAAGIAMMFVRKFSGR